jgi:hypothetical protein
MYQLYNENQETLKVIWFFPLEIRDLGDGNGWSEYDIKSINSKNRFANL